MDNSAAEKLSKPRMGRSGIQGHWIGEKQNGRPGKRRVGTVPFSRDVVEIQFVRALTTRVLFLKLRQIPCLTSTSLRLTSYFSDEDEDAESDPLTRMAYRQYYHVFVPKL